MIKKIFFQSIFLSFLSLKEAFAAESGGMPQLNPEFWVSQIFWLTVTFGIMYVVLSKLILPKISANLEIRKSQILENIEAAEKKREESEQRIKEYEKIVHDSKNEAKNYFNQAREKALKDIHSKKDALLSLGSCFRSSFFICKVPRNFIILKACEQILLSESFKEDPSGFCFFSLPLYGVIALLEIDRLDDDEDDEDDEDDDDDDDEVLESDDGGPSGKPVENCLVVFSDSSESENMSSSFSVDKSFIMTTESLIASDSFSLDVISNLFKDDIMYNNIFL